MTIIGLYRLGIAVSATMLIATPVAAEKMPKQTESAPVTILLPENITTLPPLERIPSNPDIAPPEAERRPAYQSRQYRRLAEPEFEKFESEVEFRRFMRSVEQLRRSERPRRRAELGSDEIVIALLRDDAEIGPPPECTVPEDCPVDPSEETITVTGARSVSSVQSAPLAATTADGTNITNTQVASVDEGDIVKLIGEYLLILQDGRVFAVHYPTMRLTDRTDVYRKDEDGDPIGADWYDEMLVQGDQIIVTAYSYEDDATELTVLRLDQGTGTIEPRGVFLISSDDYYDVDNYATRIVGDQLVIYTPYEADELVSRRKRLVIRRWTNAEDFYDDDRGSQVINARDIYRPIFGVRKPWIHTVSICPLGDVIDRGLRCESTGFTGADKAEMYVSGNAAYLWVSAIDGDELDWTSCKVGTPPPSFGEVPPAAVYRLPFGRGDVEVLGARGIPIDQFGMDETSTRFRALSNFYRSTCYDEENERNFALLNASQGQFRDRYAAARESEFTRLPSLSAGSVENRFVGDWVVYGGRESYSRRPPRYEESRTAALANVIHAVPVDEPERAQSISIGHSLVRLERMGTSAVIANGYVDESGLRVSYIGLGQSGGLSGIRSSAFLPGRYESESRSHAFNATYNLQGDGMLGVPTVTRVRQSSGYWWYSDVSDLSFLAFSDAGLLADAGMIAATPEDEVVTGDGYKCEVSCIDWYGNARPIFLAGRVYGLMATELVEADVVEGRVKEQRRVDITGSIAQ